MLALQTMPEACSLAPENESTAKEVRQLLHGQYCVLFAIDGQSVYILTIGHGARRFVKGDEIDSI